MKFLYLVFSFLLVAFFFLYVSEFLAPERLLSLKVPAGISLLAVSGILIKLQRYFLSLFLAVLSFLLLLGKVG